MALVVYDRVQQTGTANTTVSFTLAGTVTGYQSFSVVGNGNTTYYAATDASGNWEVGIGTYSTTGPTLTRTTILSSSNSGSAVTFSGTVNVFVTYPSENSVYTSNTPTSGYVLTANASGVAPSWQAAPSGVYTRTSFTATAGQTSFTVSYTVGYVEVYQNGALLNSTDYTASSGTAIVLASGAALGDIIEVIAYNTGGVATLANLSGGIAGAVPYQSSTNVTSFTSVGTSGQVLTSNGASAPTWTTISSGGTVTSVSGTGTVSGISLSGTVTSSGSLTLGGSLDLSSPPAIGGTTPAAGTFTNIASATSPTTTVPTLSLTGTPNPTSGGKTGVLGVGSNFTASDKNIMASFVQNINDYTQIVVQNPNAGTAASADFVVNNDNTTGTGVYGDFGINSSAFSGTGSLSLANATYLYSNGGDFVFGTNTANIVRFVINASATDIGTVTSTGLNSFPIGATTASTGAFTTLSASSTVSGTGFSTYLASPPAIGGTTPAAITGTTITDSIGNVRTIIQNAQSGATSYTLVSTDSGKHIYVTGTGGVTMPVSVFTAGQAITIVNNTAASITITGPAAGTMYLAGTATTGNRTLAQRGIATVLYVVGGATPTIIASGSGLT